MLGEQVEQQRRQPARVKRPRYTLIARAEPAAAAAVDEHHQAAGVRRHAEFTVQPRLADG